MLSKRLQVIASMIPSKRRVIDVGCDHAFLAIYLTLENKNLCIASDINKNVLEKTKKMVDSYGLRKKIPIIQSDGLNNIMIEPNDIVVIAGMGTSTILRILEKKNTNYMIIQSNNDLDLLRETMSTKGFLIDQEQVVYDRGIYYIVIAFKRGFSSYSWEEIQFGPILIKQNDLITMSYFCWLLKKKEKLFQKIPKGANEKLLKEIQFLKKLIDER